jgi:hypothetical protein
MHQDPARPRPQPVVGRKIRIDPNPPPQEAPETAEERHRFLELFRMLLGVPTRDRRFMPRHNAAEFALWLGWRRGAGEGDFFATSARLINISRGGALITAIDPPPQGHTVWICLGSPDPTDCVEATVRQVTTVRRRQCAVRLAFARPCPQDFFEAAVCGIAPGPRASAPPRRFVEGK